MLEIGLYKEHIDRVYVARWSFTDVIAMRCDMYGSRDGTFVLGLFEKIGDHPLRAVSTIILEASTFDVVDAWEVDRHAPWWRWLFSSLGIPFSFDIESKIVFDGELLLEPEAVDLYRILGTDIPFVWPNSKLVEWVEQRLSEGG